MGRIKSLNPDAEFPDTDPDLVGNLKAPQHCLEELAGVRVGEVGQHRRLGGKGPQHHQHRQHEAKQSDRDRNKDDFLQSFPRRVVHLLLARHRALS